MKIISVFLLFNLIFTSSKLEDVRNQFPEINTLEQAENYLVELENEEDDTLQGYYAAMLFMKSKHVKFPLTKLKYFKKGRLLLDELISNHQHNIEIRYIRFLLQSEMPDFLGYNKNIEEDFLYITKQVKQSNLKREFKVKMLQNMLKIKKNTAENNISITQLLNNL